MDRAVFHFSLIAIVSAVIPISNIHCGEDEVPFLYRTGRFNDVAHAINYMHYRYLPGSISREERCKRYAVFADIALSQRFPFEETVREVAMMEADNLDRHYDAMHIDRIIYVLMSAIDRYRVTKLLPQFIELIECLEQIEAPAIKTYLNNSELVLILDLYKQVLGLPCKMIDIKSVDLTKFRKAFWKTLRNLFGEYFDIDSIYSDALLASIEPNASSRSSNRPDIASTSQTRGEQRQSRRELFEYRRREYSRLTQQRLRMIDPKGMRRYQEGQRERAKRERSELWRPATTPEQAEFKRLAQERRNQHNERRRLRYKQSHLQREHQMRLLAPRLKEKYLQQAHQEKQNGQYEGQQPTERQPNVRSSEQVLSIPVSDEKMLQSRKSRPLVSLMTSFPSQEVLSPILSSVDGVLDNIDMQDHELPEGLFRLNNSIPVDAYPRDATYNQTLERSIGNAATQFAIPNSTFPAFQSKLGPSRVDQNMPDTESGSSNTDAVEKFLLNEPLMIDASMGSNKAMAGNESSPDSRRT